MAALFKKRFEVTTVKDGQLVTYEVLIRGKDGFDFADAKRKAFQVPGVVSIRELPAGRRVRYGRYRQKKLAQKKS